MTSDVSAFEGEEKEEERGKREGREREERGREEKRGKWEERLILVPSMESLNEKEKREGME